MYLIHDKKLIAARVEQKRSQVLAWLKSEGFSTTSIIGEMLGLKHRATRLTLDRMQAEQLIEIHEVPYQAGSLTVWGITPHGAAMAIDPDSDHEPDFGYFETGRLSPHTIGHSLSVQQVRLDFIRRGWAHWQTDRQCHQLNAAQGWLKIPDALAIDPTGQRVAIEVERTIKTIKRYQSIISSYLQMISANKIDRIEYVFPLPGMAARLQLMFQTIRTVPVRGQTATLTPEHLQKFTFTDFSTSNNKERRYG